MATPAASEIAVGLVGFGFAGRVFHAPVISATPGLKLAGIVQRSGDVSDARRLYPSARVVRSLDELLADSSIILVVIATPNTSHTELTRQCLFADRHAVVDKPFTPTAAEAAELTKLAESRRLVLSVYQNRRWDGDFITLQKVLASGDLGRVVIFETHFDRFRPQLKPAAWRERDEPGSGILYDLGPHLIDQALVLFGKPYAVFADVRMEREGSVVDDAFDISFFYPNLRALLRSSMLALEPGPKYLVEGTRGAYLKHRLDPQEEALKAGGAPGSPGWGEESESDWGTLSVADGDSVRQRRVRTEPGDYRGFYMNVRDAILGRAPLAVTARHASDVIRAIELARESSKRRCVVPWPQ
jgi:predicted dehydrogenase